METRFHTIGNLLDFDFIVKGEEWTSYTYWSGFRRRTGYRYEDKSFTSKIYLYDLSDYSRIEVGEVYVSAGGEVSVDRTIDLDNFSLTKNGNFRLAANTNYTSFSWIGDEFTYQYEHPVIYNYNNLTISVGENSGSYQQVYPYAYEDNGNWINTSNIYVDTSYGDGAKFVNYNYNDKYDGIYFNNNYIDTINSDYDLNIKVVATDSIGQTSAYYYTFDVYNEAPSLSNIPTTLEIGTNFNFHTSDSPNDNFYLNAVKQDGVSVSRFFNRNTRHDFASMSFGNTTFDVGDTVSISLTDIEGATSSVSQLQIVDTTPMSVIDNDANPNEVNQRHGRQYSGITLLVGDNDVDSIVGGFTNYVNNLNSLSSNIELERATDNFTYVYIKDTTLLPVGGNATGLEISDNAGNITNFTLTYNVLNDAPWSIQSNSRNLGVLSEGDSTNIDIAFSDGLFDTHTANFELINAAGDVVEMGDITVNQPNSSEILRTLDLDLILDGYGYGEFDLNIDVTDNHGATTEVDYTLSIADTTPIVMIDGDGAPNEVYQDLLGFDPVYTGITLLASDNDPNSITFDGVNPDYITGLSNLSSPGLERFIVLESIDASQTEVKLINSFLLEAGDYSFSVDLIDEAGNESTFDVGFEVLNSTPEILFAFPFGDDGLGNYTSLGEAHMEIMAIDGVFDDITFTASILDDGQPLVEYARVPLTELPGVNAVEEVIDLFGEELPGYEDSESSIRFATGSLDLSTLGKGDYTLEIFATDASGNESSEEFDISITNDSLVSDWNTRTVGDTLDVTQDNIPDSRWDRLIQTAMVYGTQDTDLSQIDSVFASDDSENLFEEEATRVITRDYNGDGNTDLRVYFSRSGLSDTIALDADNLYISGVDEMGGNLFIAQNALGDELSLV